VLVLQFWASYMKEWNDLLAPAQIIEADPTPQEKTTNIPPLESKNDAITPKEKYEYLSEYGTQILCLFDAEKGCTYLSPNFDSITGRHGSAMLGQVFYSILHEDYQDRLRALLHEPLGENERREFRCKLHHNDSKYYWYLFTIHAKKDGEPGEYVCIALNIHEQMQTQNTLQKAKLEAELALRSRSEFLANMSHDLRTPLNAVIGFSQIIESGMFGDIAVPQYVDYVRHIHESGYDLLAKIEDLLEIASIDAGRVSLAREEVHLGDILRHVCEAQAHHANAAKIMLEATPLPADILLYVDRLKMQHILGHLVGNAIKFGQKGMTITLNAGMQKGQLQLSVQDTGAGMQGEKLDQIVAALKEDNCWTTANDNRAIGLGLALTREFVALHGGQVEVRSKQAEGTTITITLPADCIRSATAVKPDYLELLADFVD